MVSPDNRPTVIPTPRKVRDLSGTAKLFRAGKTYRILVQGHKHRQTAYAAKFLSQNFAQKRTEA